MTADTPIRTTFCDWPDVAMAFIEYAHGDVAVAVKFGDFETAGRLCKSMDEAILYATLDVRFSRAMLGMEGGQT